jgi:Domain of unknown function (DUF4333)
MTKVRQLAVAVSAAGVAIGVAGCANTVSASDIASQAKTKFNQSFAAQGKSQRVASVSCPRDLNAKVGASEVCSAIGNPGSVKLNISATVTSVSGSTAHLHFQITTASATPTGTSTN